MNVFWGILESAFGPSMCVCSCLSVYKILFILCPEFVQQFCCYCLETLDMSHLSCLELVQDVIFNRLLPLN